MLWRYACATHIGIVRRSIFDIDNIDIGPERRSYLEQKLERVWESNSQVGLACACVRLLVPGGVHGGAVDSRLPAVAKRRAEAEF